MVIDARGLRHPEPLRLLREAVPSLCSLDGSIEVLLDDEVAFRHIRTYAAVSGCTYEVKRTDGFYRILIESTCA